MKKIISIQSILVVLVLFLCSVAGAQEAVPGEVLVKFAPSSLRSMDAGNTGLTSIDELNKKFGVVKMETGYQTSPLSSLRSGDGELYKLTFTSGVTVEEAVSAYSMDSNVLYAQPNYLGKFALVPDDSKYSLQDDLLVVKGPEAWEICYGNKNVVVAVIDTGVQTTHPDLAGNIWNNSDEIAGNGADDDGNGYIDDVCGWDFISASDVQAGEDGGPQDNDPDDKYGHGTAVAGVVGAVGNNGIGMAGTAWECQIMALRAGYVNSGGSAILTVFDVSSAIRYAADNGAKVVNMSFTFPSDSDALRSAVSYAASKGCFLVAAAGNDNAGVQYPALYSEVVAVAATDKSDKKADFTCYGGEIDISAPGVIIATTYKDSGYYYMSGTSFAAPRVAGGAVLLLSYNPSLSSAELRSILCNSADDIDSLNSGYEGMLGSGRLNLEKAMASTAGGGGGGGDVTTLSFNLTAVNQWVLLSFPLEEITDLTGLGRPLYNYSGNTFQVIPPTGYSQIKPGLSYWTYVTEASVLNITGKPFGFSECNVQLNSGWNQIGNPFAEENLRMSSSIQSSQNVIGESLFLYDGVSGTFSVTSFEGSSLSPWAGGWVYSSETCSLSLKK